jgi:hypothetical protein
MWITESFALGRRIRKVITNNGLSGSVGNGTTDYVYTGWQCLEERDVSNNPNVQYVWGIYNDELLQLRNDISGTPADYFPLQDMLYRTIALTDSSGNITEAYDYDAYGNTLIFSAPGSGPSWFAPDATPTHSPSEHFSSPAAATTRKPKSTTSAAAITGASLGGLFHATRSCT